VVSRTPRSSWIACAKATRGPRVNVWATLDEADDLVVGAFRHASPSEPIERDSRDLQPRLLDVPGMGTLTAANRTVVWSGTRGSCNLGG
jgi:hypothetical protein